MRKNGIKRSVVVTGGGTWIGRGIVERLSKQGYQILIVGRREKLIQEVAEACKRKGEVEFLSADVCIESDRKRIITKAIELFGKIDILINNAGITHSDPLLDYSKEGWDKVMITNLESPFYLSLLAIEDMRKRSWGRIVNITSVYGSYSLNYEFYPDLTPTSKGGRGPIRCCAYHASKGGLINLTRELAVSVAEMGITVNMVSPGMFPPDNNVHHLKYDIDIFKKNCPMKRVGRPENISHAVCYFLADDASFTTGTELVVDGGWTIW